MAELGVCFSWIFSVVLGISLHQESNGIQEVSQTPNISRRMKRFHGIRNQVHETCNQPAMLDGGNSFLRLLEQRYHFRPTFQSIKIIRPSLHHFPPLRQMFSEIIGCANRVTFGVSEL